MSKGSVPGRDAKVSIGRPLLINALRVIDCPAEDSGVPDLGRNGNHGGFAEMPELLLLGNASR